MRKAILLMIGLTLLQLNSSCITQYYTTELENNFSSEQITDLNKISGFFKNQICLNMDSDFKTCYERIPHEYLEATGNGFWTDIDFEEQKKLYDEISKSTFNEIWMFCKTTNYSSGKESKSLCANASGKYQKFLIDLGKTNPRIAAYAKRIGDSGDFNSLDIHYNNILSDNKYFNLKDPNMQLILAIHYLSLNKQQMRNGKSKISEPNF
ncbi:MAG: hypothetical protein KBT69_01650 [Oceanihabitans sp.]|nr:hypothetical protein [Oceanihabitans sp.]